MKILRFKLGGNFSHFRNPEINNKNLTFLQIHKTIIKGIIGAIIGLEGYNTSMLLNRDKIEFLDKLQSLKVGIIPKSKHGIFQTQINDYINQTGHASYEQGGTLIIHEKVLVNPSWDIYLYLEELDKDIQEKIEDYLLNSKIEYPFYLGKNHYFGVISDVELLECERENNPKYISSLFIQDYFELDEDIEDEDDLVYGKNPFLTTFFLPTNMDNELGYRDYYTFAYTNLYIGNIKNDNFLCIKKNNNIIFLI